jgi:hypothetical protein
VNRFKVVQELLAFSRRIDDAGLPHEGLTTDRQPAGIARLALVAACSTMVVTACSIGDDAAAPEATQTTSAAREPLPPTSFADLEAIFAPRFDAVGMVLTRASLVELDGGPHLQLYVEPPGDFTTDQYVDNIVPTTAAVVPFIFEQYTDLASFDVCQEPPPGIDDSVAPEQVTVVALTREQAAELEWPDTTLAQLRAVVEGAAFGEVRGNDEIEASPTYQAAAPEG